MSVISARGGGDELRSFTPSVSFCMGLKMSLGFEFFQNVAAVGRPSDRDRRPMLTMKTSETKAATLQRIARGGIAPNIPALKLRTMAVMHR